MGHAIHTLILLDIFLESKRNLLFRINDMRQKYFPERQVFLRSEGRVRFLTIGSITQQVMAISLLAAFVWAMITSYSYLTRDVVLEQKKRTIVNMSAQYELLSDDFSALEQEVEKRADLLEERQKLLEDIAEKTDYDPAEPVASEEEHPSHSANRKNDTSSLQARTLQARRLSLLNKLQRLSDNQNLFAEAMLSNFRHKRAQIDAALQGTKVDPDALLANVDTSAVGGPYIPEARLQSLFKDGDEQIFHDLIDEDIHLDSMSVALDNFPVLVPAEKYYVSSRFGRRTDPFTKRRAHHGGLDLAGWPGTKIMAGATGKVVKAGVWGALGRMVEIDHGNGIRTRYGHLRKVVVKRGDIVETGQKIGEMGSTGRSTSTHLHYEVWFNGKALDPMPFLKAAENVRKIQGRHEKANS